MMTHPTRATIPWPSTVLASTNLSVTRQWPKPPTKENGLAPTKQQNIPTRKVTISHHVPSTMGSFTTAGSPTTTNFMQSPEKEARNADHPAQSVPSLLHTPPQWIETLWRRTGMIEEKRMNGERNKEKKTKRRYQATTHLNQYTNPAMRKES